MAGSIPDMSLDSSPIKDVSLHDSSLLSWACTSSLLALFSICATRTSAVSRWSTIAYAFVRWGQNWRNPIFVDWASRLSAGHSCHSSGILRNEHHFVVNWINIPSRMNALSRDELGKKHNIAQRGGTHSGSKSQTW